MGDDNVRRGQALAVLLWRSMERAMGARPRTDNVACFLQPYPGGL